MTSDLNDEVEKVLDEADITAGESPTAGPGGKPGPESADPDDTMDLDAEKLVGFLEMGMTTAAMLVCGVSRVPFDQVARDISSLSPAERLSLITYAPYVLPYVPKFLQHADLAGAAYFGFLALTTANAKLSAMKYYIQTKKAAEEAAQGVDQGGEPTHVGPIEAPLITPAAREAGSWE